MQGNLAACGRGIGVCNINCFPNQIHTNGTLGLSQKRGVGDGCARHGSRLHSLLVRLHCSLGIFFKECLTGFWWTGCDDLVSKRGCPGGPDAADHLGPRTRQKAHRRTGTMGRPKYLPSITPSAPGRFFIGGGAERVSQRKRG